MESIYKSWEHRIHFRVRIFHSSGWIILSKSSCLAFGGGLESIFPECCWKFIQFLFYFLSSFSVTQLPSANNCTSRTTYLWWGLVWLQQWKIPKIYKVDLRYLPHLFYLTQYKNLYCCTSSWPVLQLPKWEWFIYRNRWGEVRRFQSGKLWRGGGVGFRVCDRTFF